MTQQFLFNQNSGQTITGTPSSLDELSVALTPWPADRQLFMDTVNASTLQLGTVLTPSTVGGYPDPSSFIPLYEIRRDPFQPNTFHLVELGTGGTAASATLNDIDLVSFAVPGGSELFTINLQPLILSGEAVGGTEGITEIQGTPFNDRPVITLTGISKPTEAPTQGGNGLVFKNGSATAFEVVTSMGSPSQGAQTTSGTVLRVYDTTTGQPVHEYQLDSAVESVQLVFDDGAATVKNLFSSAPIYSDAVPMSLVKSIVTSPDPIRIASMGNPSDPDTIHFRVDLNEPIHLRDYGQTGDPYQSYSLKFALKIGNNVVYADIEGANGDYSGANQLWFAYPIKATDVGAVSMLGFVEVNGTDVSAFAPYTYQTEYTGIGSLGNQALSYIYPKIEFASDPQTSLTSGGNKFVGLFDPTEINLVAEANVVLTGNRNTLGIAIDGTGGAVLSATQAGGVISIFTQVGTTSTRVAKFTQSSTDPTQYLFWTGANVDSTDVGVATTISTADFQQILLILRVQGSETDHVAQVGGTYWTFADQKPLLFSLVSREFVEPERPNDLAKVGDAFNNTLNVSAEAASKSIDLFGFQGNDTITGHDGANRIAGGAGSDTINAGKGNDALILGGMSDGPGDDVVDLGGDTDVISFNGFDNAHLFQAGTVKTAAGTEVFEIHEPGAAGARLVATVEKAANFATASQVLVTTYQADGVTPFNTALVSNAESLVNFGNNSQPYFLKGNWSPSTNGTSFYQGSIFSDVIDLSNASLKSGDSIKGGQGDDVWVLQTAAPLSIGGQWSMVSENGLTTWSYSLASQGVSQQGSVPPEFSISKHNQSGYEYWSIDDLTGAGSKMLSGLQISEVERIEIKNGTNVLRTISLVDFSAPVYQSASLRGNQLTVVFNEALDPVEKPAIEHFTLYVDGQPQSIDGVQITNAQVVGNKLTLTLSQPFNDLTRQVSIAYADLNPTMDDSFVLQDIYGNDVASTLSPESVQVIVTNHIQAAKEKFTAKSEFIGGLGKDILDMSAAEGGQIVNLFYTKSDQPTGLKHTIRDIEDLKGSNLGDTLKGNGWANTLDGNAGDDVLDGGLGDDVLLGGAGNDQLLGGFGRDVLYGGTGADVMTGGIGGDQFVLSVDDATAGGLDHITDFNFIADVIQIHASAGATLNALANLFDASTKTLKQLGAAAPTGTESSVYYDSTGKLYFDAGGAASPVLLAQLDAQGGGNAPQLLAVNIKLLDTLPAMSTVIV